MAVSSLGINHEDLRLLLLAAACQSTKRNGNEGSWSTTKRIMIHPIRVNRTRN